MSWRLHGPFVLFVKRRRRAKEQVMQSKDAYPSLDPTLALRLRRPLNPSRELA